MTLKIVSNLIEGKLAERSGFDMDIILNAIKDYHGKFDGDDYYGTAYFRSKRDAIKFREQIIDEFIGNFNKPKLSKPDLDEDGDWIVVISH